MSTDPTQPQGGRERRQSRQMSLKRGQPPTQVPGYEPEKFLGVGAYGEVWVAREINTGRRVAIKFYAHRGGLDWSLLSREVEKLAFLFADRYVVQLLGVGWDAEPPYYIMEYLERGSLAERLQQGPLPTGEAVALFRDVATGLVHAHGKGVLHCDLKPANVLLDQDNKPRLADFGQSRLSHEQSPALGTLFYMAPEQADLEAVPDARWDVYALGALLYCMLTGGPPHRTAEAVKQFDKTPQLVRRLTRYRRLIEQSPPPTGHRQVRGVDRSLAEIVDRCLAPDPQKRFPNVQAVLDALDDRALRHERRPMVILGAALPALLLLVVTWFAWQGFSTAVQQSTAALTDWALRSNYFAARYVARTAAAELERRFEAVEQVASSERLRQALEPALSDPELRKLLAQLGDPHLDPQESERLCRQFQEHPVRRTLQREFAAMLPADLTASEEVASWFFCDAGGVSTVRVPQGTTIGKGFAWRSYFHGGPADMKDESWRPEPGAHLSRTTLSAVFPSHATNRWIVAVSAPVFADPAKEEFLGVVALTVEVGRFAELQGGNHQFAVLVDRRQGDNEGMILQHPVFDKLLAELGELPSEFKTCRLQSDDLPDVPERMIHYADPLAPLAVEYDSSEWPRRWLARMEPVYVRGEDTGWAVIVQEAYDTAIGTTLDDLRQGLIRRGLAAVSLIVLLMVSLWWFATRLSVRH
ncbi:MAG: protein kinase [Pirellulales bacterium]|nr:protein kinase [Pirellulales bacterium]